MSQNFIKQLKIIVLGIVLSLGVSYVSAWQPPTSSAPGGGTPAPLNTSSSAQTKEGALTIKGSSLTSTIFQVQNGPASLDSLAVATNASIGTNMGIGGDLKVNKLASSTESKVCAKSDGTIVLCDKIPDPLAADFDVIKTEPQQGQCDTDPEYQGLLLHARPKGGYPDYTYDWYISGSFATSAGQPGQGFNTEYVSIRGYREKAKPTYDNAIDIKLTVTDSKGTKSVKTLRYFLGSYGSIQQCGPGSSSQL